MDQNQPTQNSSERKSIGPAIGIVIIVIVLIIGALYFWGGKLNDAQVPSPTEEAASSEGTLSVSDELEDIANDLQATVIESSDADIEGITTELNTPQ